ncbi:uncharacterized protein LOC141601615 [Silene latifolia]|uniref:uncharacterized protein LOC141601615 n=1 Tax=Silene latifolia TaxID=37657 RepID=UPI003D76FE0B
MSSKHEKASRSDLCAEVILSFTVFVKNNKRDCDLNTDMIFIPILLYEHFSCLCINFNAKRVEYLDNVFQEALFADDQQPCVRLVYCQTVLSLMSDFLVQKGVARGGEVKDYKIVNVPFTWQTAAIENLDCGVYTMLHMLFYRGTVFDCDLGNSDSRALYQAEIAVLLVLSDMNDSREDVLKTLEELNKTRKETLSVLEEKQRIEDTEARGSQSAKKRRGSGRVKTVGKKVKTTQPVVEPVASPTVIDSTKFSINTPTATVSGEAWVWIAP